MKERGVYCVVDGGYHRWATTMSASRLIVEENLVLWRERMESVRKDIKDISGVLKGRFRVLKLPKSLQKKNKLIRWYLLVWGFTICYTFGIKKLNL